MKKLALLGVGALSLAALASCGVNKAPNKPSRKPIQDVVMDTTDYLSGKTLNVYINYKGKMGVTYTGKESKLGATFTNPVDGKTYTKGDILPMWSQVQTNLNITVRDAVWDFQSDAYTKTSEKDVYTAINGDSNFNTIDLLMTNSAQMNEFVKNDQLVNLADYLGVMPNLYQFLKDHPAIKDELMNTDGEMYIAPYFDGVDTIEKMFIMNTELVEKLLDEDGNYDTTEAKATAYTPYINTSKDYKIQISVNGVAQDLTVKAATNPVQAQNDLATKNGKTYVEALKAYIDAAYMSSGKYTKRSEVFVSESACYSTDDLIALMRCAVNNSVYLFGEAGKVHGIIPRGEANNRVITILQLAQIWGIQGLTAETDYLYYDKAGNLCDARTTSATYDALEKLNQLKSEGLIIDGWDQKGDGNGTKYTASYLSGVDGAALMIYDYNATQAVWNKLDAETGIGTANAKYDGIMPVLPPVTTWENNDITNSKYAYSRYTEDSRAFKGAGTVVPKKDDVEQIKAACMLIDYFYSEEGAILQDYGPQGYHEGTITVAGVTYPKITSAVFESINTTKLGWNDWYRAVVGATQGIGHVRSDGLDYQVTHPAGREGLANVLNAIKSGALVCATTARNPGFGATVPAKWDATANTTDIQTLVDFWAQGTNNTHWRAVINGGWDAVDTKRNTLESLFETSNLTYLNHYQNLLNIKLGLTATE